MNEIRNYQTTKTTTLTKKMQAIFFLLLELYENVLV